MSATPNFAHVPRSRYGGFDYKSAMAKFFADGGSTDVAKKAAFTSSDAGRSNDVFGAVLWNQVNVAAPAYGLLPKIDATGAGPNSIDDPRPQTFRAAHTPPSMSTPGEGGSWSTSVDFETEEVKADPHHSQLKFEATIIQQIESRLQDDVPLDQIEALMDEYWREEFEVSGILRGVNSASNGGTQYSNDNAIVSLDRVIASQDEETNADGIGGTALDDGDLDVYGIDRSNVTWADAVVDHNSANGDRPLTEDVIDSTIQSLVNNGANLEDLVILTGSDTARVMDELRESRVRFEPDTSLNTEDVEGEQSRAGASAVTRFRDWDGIPIVEAHNVPSDSLSRIYILDVSTMEDPNNPGQTVPKIGVETYFGPIVERAGPGQQTNTLATDNLADEVGYLQTHEVVCRRFSHQAKIRDLSE